MSVDTRRGTEGQRAWLRSPVVEVGNSSCLTFNLYLLFSPRSSEDSFRLEYDNGGVNLTEMSESCVCLIGC